MVGSPGRRPRTDGVRRRFVPTQAAGDLACPRPGAVGADASPICCSGASRSPSGTPAAGDEHLRLIAKQEAGCSFFVTQVVYDVNAAKNLVSDYRYECAARGLEPVPIVFTFSVCGSTEDPGVPRWLGVDVPRWIQNDLRHADDTLEASLSRRSRRPGADRLLPTHRGSVRAQR